jgi:hypothetical protein
MTADRRTKGPGDRDPYGHLCPGRNVIENWTWIARAGRLAMLFEPGAKNTDGVAAMSTLLIT